MPWAACSTDLWKEDLPRVEVELPAVLRLLPSSSQLVFSLRDKSAGEKHLVLKTLNHLRKLLSPLCVLK